jgi:4-hydroxy-tetrahydrodipicolinate synthase
MEIEMSIVDRIRGVIPAVTTPFHEDGSLDQEVFQKEMQFMVEAGAHGVCVGGSTGEGHTLDTQELQTIWKAAVKDVGGKMPVVAGVIINSTRQAVERCQMARDAGVIALQVTPPYYVFKPSEDALLEHFRTISEKSGLPVIIYNVVPWCYLSPALLARIMREVPGVVGVKQSNGDLKLFADLLVELPKGKLVFTAVDALLYPSFMLGAHGTIAALPTAIPAATVALWNAVRSADHKRALSLHEAMLGLWNTIACDDLPACVKYVQSLQGMPLTQPRAPMRLPDSARRTQINRAYASLKEVLSA